MAKGPRFALTQSSMLAELLVFLSISIAPFATNAGPRQVAICHDGQTLRVSEQSARNHVQQHEKDFLGDCGRGEIYGVDRSTKRMIDIYTPCQFERFAERAGLDINLPGAGLGDYCSRGADPSGSEDLDNIDTAFNIVAVSGTLEEGFPLRRNLDFEPGTPNQVLSTFLGRALIRGLKANLDIKSPGWREFRSESEGLNPVNPGMVATGNWNDANIYSVYLIDRRQAIRALLNEPRFLSMTPDLAMVDIAAEETSDTVRALILQAIGETNLELPKNQRFATLLTVVSTWSSCHFIPSPILYVKPDGTRVTDFPNSLAAFAGVTDQLRITDPASYNEAVETAIRQAVDDTADCDQ
ncbi:MAG: hypothetical protein ACU843_11940 [Gammaproteobacteria bacterium]